MPRGTRNIGSVLLHGVPWQPREILFESLFSKTLVCDEEQACSRLLEVVHSFLLLISVDEAMDRYVDPTFQQVVFSFAQLVAKNIPKLTVDLDFSVTSDMIVRLSPLIV